MEGSEEGNTWKRDNTVYGVVCPEGASVTVGRGPFFNDSPFSLNVTG